MRVVLEADGGSRGNPGPAGYGAVVKEAGSGRVLAERAAGIGRATNNVAEYGGLIAGLQAALELGADAVDVRMDSKLVVEQMSGRWQVKHPAMKPLQREAAGLVARLGQVSFTWIPRASNGHADRLANEAMDAAAAGRTWQQEPADAFLEKASGGKLEGWAAPDLSAPCTTLLLRHGQTPLSVEKRFSGVGDPELTDVGRRQAAAAATRLASSGATAVVHSPLTRAAQTAALVAHALGVEPQVEEDLRETDFGDWEGSTFGEVAQEWPDEMTAWLADTSVAPPHGESFDATTVRVQQARARLLERHAGQTVVVVSHVTPIKTLLRLALDAPPSALYRMHLDLACVSEVRWYADGPAVVRSMNDTSHLSGEGLLDGLS